MPHVESQLASFAETEFKRVDLEFLGKIPNLTAVHGWFFRFYLIISFLVFVVTMIFYN